MEHIGDALTLVTMIEHAGDNEIFVRAGSLSAPYCAYSLRNTDDMLGFLTWGTVRWIQYATPNEYAHEVGKTDDERHRLIQTWCVGCRRRMRDHYGDGLIMTEWKNVSA